MISLPIVGRELLVAARNPGTFRWRWIAVLAAGVVATGFLLISLAGSNMQSGAGLFSVLTGLSFAAALLAGVFLTSDSISEEKRAGTLGFLFLTELRGLDVVAGKLMSTSLRGVYSLLGIFPILAIPILLGGVSGAQFWKTVVALLSTLVFSLSAGLLVSALSRDSQRAMAGTLFLVAILTLGGIAWDSAREAIAGRSFPLRASLISPGLLFWEARSVGATFFWPALVGVNLCSLLLFIFACLFVPRSWQDKRSSRLKSKTCERSYGWRYGAKPSRDALRRKLLDRNPVLWLVCRQRWQALGMWLLVSLLLGAFVLLSLVQTSGVTVIWMPLTALTILGVYVWAAAYASRFFVEARRTRAVELILASPLDEKQIVEGHWRGLLRVFAIPVLILLLVSSIGSVLFGFGTNRNLGISNVSSDGSVALVASLISFVTTLANLIAIAWFGMWMGVTSKHPNVAALKTLLFVQVIPWFILTFGSGMAVALLMMPFMNTSSGMGRGASIYLFGFMLLPALLIILKDLFFFILARRLLYSSFRERVVREFIPAVVLPPRIARVQTGPDL